MNTGKMNDFAFAWEDVPTGFKLPSLWRPPSDHMATEPQGMLGSPALSSIPSAPLQGLFDWLGLNQGGLLCV